MRKKTLVGSFVLIACSLTLWSDAIPPSNGTYSTEAASISSTTPPTSAVTRPVPASKEPAPSSLTYLDFKNGFRWYVRGSPPRMWTITSAEFDFLPWHVARSMPATCP
jgi:hypothetical protein